jgi:hypothetical protein
MPRKLKVYRTAIGFHDAYVAAPSQKAALAAWGTERDLFARGVAELVTDPKLTKEPLARPGEIIRRSRGSAAEQIAALPKAGAGRHKPKEPAELPSKATPKPSRADLEEAEAALSTMQERHQKEDEDLARKEQALTRERQKMEARHAAEAKRIERARDEAERTYRLALKNWQG